MLPLRNNDTYPVRFSLLTIKQDRWTGHILLVYSDAANATYRSCPFFVQPYRKPKNNVLCVCV